MTRLWCAVLAWSAVVLMAAASRVKNVAPNELSALHDIYVEGNGPYWSWRNVSEFGPVWNFSVPSPNPCNPQWQGLSCLCVASCVINRLTLVGLNVSGRISHAIGNLTQLTYLEFTENQISGTIPDSIGTLQQLHDLRLNGNYLSGTIPSSLGSLSSVLYFDLYDNNLNGTIPDSLCNLTQVSNLFLFGNELSGTIPLCFSTLEGIANLDLNENHLTGPLLDFVPSSLLQFSVYYNELTGTIPATLVNATNSSLQFLYLDGNLLDGKLPELHLPSLLGFDIDTNMISGTIPDSLCESQYLNAVDVAFNSLEGTVPQCLGSLNLIDQLILDTNQFTGPLPEVDLNHTAVLNFVVSNNHLSQSIPASLCNLKAIELVLGQNLFSGSLPDCDAVLDMLLIDLSDNLFTGTLPAYVSTQRGLDTFNVYDNQFSGPLPTFNNSPTLGFFYAQNNQFSGTIPLSSGLAILRYVDISNNQLTGTLPDQFFQNHQYLKSFAASSNCIHGTVPSSICSIDGLLFLDLDGLSTASSCRTPIFPHIESFDSFTLKQHIEGDIPSCLFAMSQLETLHLSGNSIVWSFPSDDDLIITDTLVELSLSHNRLTGTIPLGIQHRVWNKLDLSFNELTGTLDMIEQHDNSSLVLQVNRLSGVIPSSILNLLSINILTGNLFECNYYRTGLPPHDETYQTYQCGSNLFNQATIAWAVLLGATLTAGCIVGLYRYFVCSELMDWCKQIWDTVSMYLSFAEEMEGSSVWRFRAELLMLRDYIVALAVGVMIVFLPVYAAITHYFKTVQYQYAWTVSAAFLAGVFPACFLLVVFMGWLVALLLIWLRLKKTCANMIEHSRQRDRWNKSTVLLLLQLMVVLINCIVMVAANGGYVLIILNYNSQIVFCAQIAIALFKLVWNDFAIRGMFAVVRVLLQRWQRTVDDRTTLTDSREVQIADEMPFMTFVVLFNCIIAPCLATAAVDSQCFYNVFSAPAAVSSNFPVYLSRGSCDAVSGCILSTNLSYLKVTYDPPYIYSYQCSSSIITNYASVYVLMYLVVAFIKPLGLFLLQRLYTKIPPGSCLYILVNNSMYDLLKPISVLQNHKTEVLFYKERFILRLIGKIAVFVTFGVVFPPLAVVTCVAFMSEIYVNLFIVGRFLEELKVSKTVNTYREMLNRDCEGCMQLLLVPLARLVVPFAAFFYAFFVSDIYGYKVGFKQAAWAPGLLASTPPLLAVGLRVWETVHKNKTIVEVSESTPAMTEMSVLNTLRVNQTTFDP